MYKKKILIVLLVVLIILGMMSVVSNASTDGVITGETVKLREGPSLDSGLVTLLSVDNKVEVLSKEGDWYQVKYKNYEGYVYADYIKVNGEVEDTTVSNQIDNNTVTNEPIDNNSIENNTVVSEPAENTTTVDNNSVANTTTNTNENIVGTNQKIIEDTELKILPLINSSSIGTLTKDTSVTVNDEANGWAYVSSNTLSGWVRVEKMNSDQVESDSQPETTAEDNTDDTQTAEPVSEQSQTGYISAGSVNVRESASTSANVITTLTRNTEVTIENVENGWAKITTASGISGYVSNEYISNEQIQETNRGNVTRSYNKEEVVEETTETKKEVSNASIRSKGEDVANYATSLLGKAYTYGGIGPNSFDCSGFTKYVYGKFGVNLSHSASAQANVGNAVSKSNLQLGDMVFFSQGGNSIGHVGIFVGNNSFIHAANPKKGVVITSLSDGYYTKNYITARRVFL